MSKPRQTPNVTFVMLCYKQEQYVEAAIRGALAQDYLNLDIVISDDNSSDRTFEVAEQIASNYEGPHSIRCQKNKKNMGLTEHLNFLMSGITTELVVVAAGDDVSLPNRVSKIVEAYLREGRPMLLSSKAYRIAADGKKLDGFAPATVIPIENLYAVVSSLDTLDSRVGLYLGASGAWRMDLWNKYGPILYEHCWEDVVMGFRSALEGSYYHIDEPLLEYRVGIGLSTAKATSLKDKVISRKAKALLKRDLAKQRYQDIQLSVLSPSLMEAVNEQVRRYTIMASIYTSPGDFLSAFKLDPLESVAGVGREVYFYMRAFFSVFLRRK